jgi:hypothetical protein
LTQGGQAVTIACMRRLWGPVVLCALACSSAARAADTVSEPIQFAAHEHDMGYRAYVAKEYDQAAAHFENAFFAAPNPAELRSAIRARREAGEYARAATLAALGLRKYADDAALDKLAGEVIAQARPRVLEVRLASQAECNLTVDDKVVTAERTKALRFYLAPGRHELVVGWSDGRTRQLSLDAKAGAVQSMSLEPPQVPSPVAGGLAPSSAPDRPPTPAPERPVGVPVVAVGIAATAVLGGLTIWSGLDAENNPGTAAVRADCVGQGESCPQYQQGVAAQRRTNILLAATGVTGAVTVVLGLFFTQWSHADPPAPGAVPEGHTKRRIALRLEPAVGLGQAGLVGTF